MKTLPIDLARQIKFDIHALTYFFELELKSTHTYYWTSYNQNLFYDSHWYEAKGITFDAVNVSLLPQADSMNLEIQNVDKKFSTLVLANEIRGKAITIKEAALDKNNGVLGVVTVFYGFVDSMEINQRKATIDVYNHIIQWKKLTPRRMHSATCPWVFKDVASVVIGTNAAGYTCILDHPADASNIPITGANYTTYWTAGGAGAVAWVSGTQYSAGTCRYPIGGAGTWCDQSWERCDALANTANFGGFRWLPGLILKDIWWGKTPAKLGTR